MTNDEQLKKLDSRTLSRIEVEEFKCPSCGYIYRGNEYRTLFGLESTICKKCDTKIRLTKLK